MAIPENIEQLANDIRTKIYGTEVRESLAKGIEEAGNIADETKVRQDELETQFKTVIDETTGKDVVSAPEILAARVSVTGTTYTTLKERLDQEHESVTTQLARTSNEIVDARGGETVLKNRLDKVDQKYQDVTAQLAEKAKELDLEVERERINNLVANAGDVSNNAELLDIRVGANGKTYSTAGEMVRDIRRDLEELGVIGLNIYDKNNVHLNQYPPNDATIINGEYSSLLTLVGRSTTKPFDMGTEDYHSFVTRYVTGLTVYNAVGNRVAYITGTPIDGTEYTIFQYTVSPYRYCGFRFDTNNKDLVEIYKGNTLPDEKYRFSGKKLLSDVSLQENDDFKSLKSDLEILQNNVSQLYAANNVSFYMPSNVYFLKGIADKRKVLYKNVVVGYDRKSYRLLRYGNYKNMPEYFLVDGTQSTSGYTNLVKRNDPNNTTIATKTTYWHCIDPTTKENPSTTKNIIMIGDSFTDEGTLPALVKKKLTVTYGFSNFNFVGSRVSTKEGITTRHEGHAGYTIKDFIKNDNTLGRGTVSPNPFLSNGTVSIRNLLSGYGFTGDLDYVVIELGVNDILDNHDTTTLSADMTELINLVRSEYPNSLIYLVGLVPVSEVNDFINPEYHNKNVQDANLTLEILSGTISNCTFIDVSMLFNTDYAYPYQVVSVYGDNTDTMKVQTDYLHPSRTGYDMISECIVAGIINSLKMV